MDNLPAPDVIAAWIVESLAAALEQFRAVAEPTEGSMESIVSEQDGK
ncbi:MAG: hypothetical protein P4L39_02870 [Humidesulfovibrio sp.]|nr:hypothetical protein [Humidesulfovibrio sp.]